MQKARWRQIAYLARYGHQPVDVLLGLSLRDLNSFQEAISEIVERENGPGK